jgi:hypothetical protein
LIGSYTPIISFHAFSVPNVCILNSWRWPNGWLKLAVIHWVYILISVYFFVLVGTIIVCTALSLAFIWSCKLTSFMWCIMSWRKCKPLFHFTSCNSGNLFDFHMSMHRKYISKVQQTRCNVFLELFISINSSTCFRRFLHPSSGAQNCTYNVRYCQTNTAACCYHGWDGTPWRAIYRNK